jgi:hypothetical protein
VNDYDGDVPVVIILIAALILGGVVAVAMGRGGELAKNRGDAPRQADFRTWSDVARYRPPAALLGYHAATTEQALSLIARTLAERDAEIAWLRSRLAEAGVGPTPDLSAAEPSGAELSGAELSGAAPAGADLPVADLSGVDPAGADLDGADLDGADLAGSDLSVAGLSEADISAVDLSEADFPLADAAEADAPEPDPPAAVAADDQLADQDPADITALDLPVLGPHGARVAAASDAEPVDLGGQPGWSDRPASGSRPALQAGFIARQTPAPRVGDDR